jgi:hypothetical protein
MRAIMSSAYLLGSGLGLALIGCAAGDVILPSTVELRAVSGGGQEATVGSRLPNPLVVGVSDNGGSPLADVRLVFRFQSEFPEAEIEPAEVRTDASGKAAVEVTLGSTAGTQTVEATLVDDIAPDARAVFGVTALERRGRGRDGGGEDDEDDDDD